MSEKKNKGFSFSFLIGKTRSFLGFCAGYINEQYKEGATFIEIDGSIKGSLYFEQPKDKNIKFEIKKEELVRVKPEILDQLPEKMFFV